MRPFHTVSYLCLLLSLEIFTALPLNAQALTKRMFVQQNLYHDVSPPLRTIKPLRPQPTPRILPWRRTLRKPTVSQVDPLVQTTVTTAVPTSTALNFEGVGDGAYGYTVNVAPPDTNGAVGATQYVQWVNTSFAVFDKQSGALLYGPAAGNTLWSGINHP